MGILSRFIEPPKPMPPGFRYRMLVIILCALAFMTILELTSTSTPTDSFDRYDDIVFILVILFYFVAYQFAWPTPVNVILRILSWICLVFILFFCYIRTRSDPYGGVFLILAFLFYFLAYKFKWSTRVTVIMRVLAWIWIVFTLFYILYLSRVLYPLPSLP